MYVCMCAYVCAYMCAYVCEGVSVWRKSYVIQKKWLADILHTYLKKVDLMYMYFMYFSESSRYLHVF